NYTDFSYIVKEEFSFDEGIFSGYDPQTRKYDKSSWDSELDADGYVKVDASLQHPRCGYQWLKRHYASYTPEKVESACGTPKEKFLHVCEKLA
ncbi:formate dehydrogenase O alpha subunit, partial [Mycobacterium tuberculosis]|nr:formate dehydrogenase O alpha subunit [Mycobacterium tuberculosis]